MGIGTLKNSLWVVLLLLGQSLFAEAKLDFTASQQISMTGPSCEILNAHAQSIAGWTQSLKNMVVPVPECFCSSKNCVIDVGPISPHRIKELTNFQGAYSKESAYNGPNCFNTALMLSETLQSVTYTHPAEMDVILDTSLCVERKLDEELVAGDILLVRDQSQKFISIHAGSYINPSLSFSKYGDSSSMPYSYGTDVEFSYGVREEECRRVYGTPKPGDPCYKKPYVNFFKCSPHYKFFSKLYNSEGGLNSAVQRVYAASSTLDLKISGIALDGDRVSVEDIERFMNELEELYQRSGVLKNDPALTDLNREFARLLNARIFSLFDQARIISIGLGDKTLVRRSLKPPG